MKQELLEFGVALAVKYGVVNVTRRAIAKRARVSEALVSHHLGNREALHKAIKRQMRKQGYEEPSAAEIEKAGKRLRAKKNPAPARKRTAKEVEAIKRKGVAKKPVARNGIKPTAVLVDDMRPTKKPRSAARMPKLPPLPVPVGFAPVIPVMPALPPLPASIEDSLEKKAPKQ
jgi:AcrR family transcriptional regulator